MNWKARPTTYKAIEMRSRLEARFAAQMDRHSEPWVYEPRAFANERGQYLPDFLLTAEPHIYVEVKPTLAAAEAVLQRMEIIWDSEPMAGLMVVTADGWVIGARAGDRVWQREVFEWSEMDW